MHPDELRDPLAALEADPRNCGRVVLGAEGVRRRTLKDHHADVAEIELHEGVPSSVRVQFDTARNVYLYAWYVYRFYPVALLQAHACLELALRERFGEELDARKWPRPGLRALLKRAVDAGFFSPDGFEVLRGKARAKAAQRTYIESIRAMQRAGIEEMRIPEPEIATEDWDFDFIQRLPDSMSFVRNHYAHGSTSLDDRALGALRLVSEIINQIHAVRKDQSC